MRASTLEARRRHDCGDHAADEFLSAAYGALCRMAESKIRGEPRDAALEPTALVHEAWLRIAAGTARPWRSRTQFVAVFAMGMRRILLDHARHRHAVRHGGDWKDVSAEIQLQEISAPDPSGDIVLLHDVLTDLARRDARMAELVTHRFYSGLTLQEAADAMGISERTARREWVCARAWMRHELLRELR